MSDKMLCELVDAKKDGWKDLKPEIVNIPKYIADNLKYTFFDWQREAFENLLVYENQKSKLKKNPTHLMFNMATGTGKTLLMAASILYYYKKGYRHFLFFVNQKNIIDKTENNFIESTHPKYLFAEKIIIDAKTIAIQKVENFSDEPQGIEIKFTSIHKLYNDIHIEKENQMTLDNLLEKKIVMLADEAHHLNTDTAKNKGDMDWQKPLKNTASEAEVERKGWEHTVNQLILQKNGQSKNNKNILLEFTATIPDKEAVKKKYQNKIIYQFELKDFLRAGYTKQINLISSSMGKKKRILQALLFNWYRHQIALKNEIANFKPVILFRSKTIEESEKDYERFIRQIDNITKDDFDFLLDIDEKFEEANSDLSLFEMGDSRIKQILDFISKNNITQAEIADFVKNEFQEKNIIITNSKDKSARGVRGGEKTTPLQEKLLNSLEDKNNHIRAIFTVQRLTEGWDVLNLFDIVRLYESRDEGHNEGKRITGKATTQEKQLIGRGVRYCPFSYPDKEKNKRKFDDDLENEMRILEELFFHSDANHRYISELKRALKEEGYISDDREMRPFGLKKEFKQTQFFKNAKIWYNTQEDNPNRRKTNLQDIKNQPPFEYHVPSLEMKEEEVNLELEAGSEVAKADIHDKKRKTCSLKCRDIELHIFRKAMHIKAKQENSLFQFHSLKKELKIQTIDDLRKPEFLGDCKLNIILEKSMQYDDVASEYKLEMTTKFLEKVFEQLKDVVAPKVGSEFMPAEFKKFFANSKTKSVNIKAAEKSKELAGELKNRNWYVLDSFIGTDEEIRLIEFIRDNVGNLEGRYKSDAIYLLRNEEVYKIYDFEQGRGFQPDFLLFLQSKNQELHYQIFIEPKGNQYKDADGGFQNSKERWKEKFLEQITEKYGLANIVKAESEKYSLIGLPFFNDESQSGYEEFQKIL